jgi:RNA polymerase sigma factor (sigma-70 family)
MNTPSPARRGDEAELYARLGRTLSEIVAHHVSTSRANVEDACSFAWLQMLRYQPARETLLAWLVRTGTREAIRLDRRDRRYEHATDDLGEPAPIVSVCRPIEAHLDLLAARDAIADARLRAREREILAAHIAGYRYSEIADATGITPRTVERQLLRAKRRLRGARERQRGAVDDGARATASR